LFGFAGNFPFKVHSKIHEIARKTFPAAVNFLAGPEAAVVGVRPGVATARGPQD
jgi:hypothetical protein